MSQTCLCWCKLCVKGMKTKCIMYSKLANLFKLFIPLSFKKQYIGYFNEMSIMSRLKYLLFYYLSKQYYRLFLCPRNSKNGGWALSVTPVCACVRPFVRPSVRPLSKFGVCSITFERLHRFNLNLVC